MSHQRVVKALLKYAQSAYEFVHQHGGPEDEGFLQRRERTFFGRDGWARTDRNLHFVPWRFFGLEEDVTDLDEAKQLVKVLNQEGIEPFQLKDSSAENPEKSSDLRKILIQQNVYPILGQYMNRCLHRGWGLNDFADQALFEQVAMPHVNYWDTPEVEYRAVTPVCWVSCEDLPRRIDDNLDLIELTPQLKSELVKTKDSEFHKNFLWRSTCALRSLYTCERDKTGIPVEVRSKHRSAINGLRLMGSGTPDACWIALMLPKNFEKAIGWSHSARLPNLAPTKGKDGEVPRPNDQVKIDQSNFGEFVEIYQSLRAQDELWFALRWLNKAYGRNTFAHERDDQYVDLLIALEATAGRDVGAAHRALRIAWLLRNEYEPIEANRTVKAVSDARNAIVHRGQSARDELGDQTHKVLEEGTELVTLLLRKYLEEVSETTTLADVHTDVDDAIEQRIGEPPYQVKTKEISNAVNRL